jgi:hypothetical protein
VAIYERSPEGPGPERELEVEQGGDADRGAERRQDEPRPPEHARVDREHEQDDRRDEQEREPVVRDRDAEQGGRPDDPPVGASGEGHRRRGLPANPCTACLPAEQPERDAHDQRDVERVDVRRTPRCAR